MKSRAQRLIDVAPEFARILVAIDAYWAEDHPDGPDSLHHNRWDQYNLWTDLRAALKAAEIPRDDECPRDAHGDIDTELMARLNAATDAARERREPEAS